MSPALNGSSAIRRFEGSDAIEIRDGITFDFYMGLPHVHCTLMGNTELKIPSLLLSTLARGFKWGIYSCNVRAYVCTHRSRLGMSIWSHAWNASRPGRISDTCIIWRRWDIPWRRRTGRTVRLVLHNVHILQSQVHKRMLNTANGWQLSERK